MNFGPTIKKLREDHGLTQMDLAKRAGVSQSMVSKIEARKFSPKLDDAESILSVFGFELELRSKK